MGTSWRVQRKVEEEAKVKNPRSMESFQTIVKKLMKKQKVDTEEEKTLFQ